MLGDAFEGPPSWILGPSVLRSLSTFEQCHDRPPFELKFSIVDLELLK